MSHTDSKKRLKLDENLFGLSSKGRLRVKANCAHLFCQHTACVVDSAYCLGFVQCIVTLQEILNNHQSANSTMKSPKHIQSNIQQVFLQNTS